MFSFSSRLFAKSLVVAETLEGKVVPATFAAITAAAKLGSVNVLVAGADGAAAAKQLSQVKGVEKILHADGAHFDNGLPEEVAPLINSAVKKEGYTHVLAATSCFGKNVIPRAAAQADCMPISDVSAIHDESTFERQTYAGNAIVTLTSADPVKFMTVRGTSFDRAPTEGGSAEVTPLESTPAKGLSTFVKNVVSKSDKPDLTTASNIIVGGRGMKNGENFKILDELAQPLNAAIGATRAVVDAGYVPNELQIGQTGKTVAPIFYLGCGVSGAIQHLAGMKDSKVIAVINNDEDAPFFQVADYGLVADLFDAVPKLTKLVKG